MRIRSSDSKESKHLHGTHEPATVLCALRALLNLLNPRNDLMK